MTSIIVTTVHGTWARSTAWIGESSILFHALRTQVANPIVPDKFLWSGNNNHEDRHLAALALHEHCLRVRARHGQQMHVIIAHSHGGNVVQYARKLSGLDQHVDLFIFLGTPFLTFRRNRHIHTLIATFRMFELPLLMFCFENYFLFISIALKRISDNYVSVAFASLVLLLITVFTFYVGFELNRQRTTARTKFRQIIRYIAAFEEPKSDPKCRVITHIFDEPYLYLQLLIWFNNALEFVYATLHWIIRRRNGITVLFVFWLIIHGRIEPLFFAFIVIVVFYLLFVIVLAFGFFITSVGLRNNPWGLGRETFVTGLLYKIAISRDPFVTANSRDQSLIIRKLTMPLFHSIYYRDDGCIHAIARWINESILSSEKSEPAA